MQESSKDYQFCIKEALDNAKKRNNMRPRKLPDAIVEKDWKNSQTNIAIMKKLFGKDFVQVTNDDDNDRNSF